MIKLKDKTQRKNRIRAGRHGFLNVLEAVRSLPDDFLYRRIRTSGGYGGHDVPRHPCVGLGVRPCHRHHRRPYVEPLGEVPPLPALSCRPVRTYRHTDFLYTSFWRHQRALRFALRRHEPQPERTRHAFYFPHDVRLHRKFHCPAAVHAHGKRFQRTQYGHSRPTTWLADGCNGHCGNVRLAFLRMLLVDQRTGKTYQGSEKLIEG